MPTFLSNGSSLRQISTYSSIQKIYQILANYYLHY